MASLKRSKRTLYLPSFLPAWCNITHFWTLASVSYEFAHRPLLLTSHGRLNILLQPSNFCSHSPPPRLSLKEPLVFMKMPPLKKKTPVFATWRDLLLSRSSLRPLAPIWRLLFTFGPLLVTTGRQTAAPCPGYWPGIGFRGGLLLARGSGPGSSSLTSDQRFAGEWASPRLPKPLPFRWRAGSKREGAGFARWRRTFASIRWWTSGNMSASETTTKVVRTLQRKECQWNSHRFNNA